MLVCACGYIYANEEISTCMYINIYEYTILFLFVSLEIYTGTFNYSVLPPPPCCNISNIVKDGEGRLNW